MSVCHSSILEGFSRSFSRIVISGKPSTVGYAGCVCKFPKKEANLL